MVWADVTIPTAHKFALVIGNSDYDDTALPPLTAPIEDVNTLAELLRDDAIGGFDEVATLIDKPLADVQPAVADFFAEKRPDDLLVVYFSGHGVLDERGRLYLAVKNTRRLRLSGTALPATYITDEMDNSRSKRQVVILDCCHSGAFARGAKAATGAKAITQATFEGHGYGRTVLTATDATQYAWEGDQVIGQAENSIFTHFLVEGLRTGDADQDGDGQISLDEWYDYVFERVIRSTSKQTPGKWAYKQQGELVIARNARFSRLKPGELPLELMELLVSRDASQREAGVRWLAHLLSGAASGPALAAQDALRRLANDDSRRVANAAAQALVANEKRATEGPEQLGTQSSKQAQETITDKQEPLHGARERARLGPAEEERFDPETPVQERLGGAPVDALSTNRDPHERATKSHAAQKRVVDPKFRAANTKRYLLAGVLAFALLGLAALGRNLWLGGTQLTPTDTAQSQPTRTAAAVVVESPVIVSTSTSIVIRRALVAREGDTFTPDLAFAWEGSDDRLKWTFQLHQNVTMSDGSEFSAFTVEARLETWSQVQSGDATVEGIDDYTFQIHLATPTDATDGSDLLEELSRIEFSTRR